MNSSRNPSIKSLLLATTLTLGVSVSAPAMGQPATAPAGAPQPAAGEGTLGEDAPNVLVWMLDDVGFGQLSSYGGLVPTPNIDRVAARGLRYSNYHTTPVCSPSRAAFLTGRNPHTVHVGAHAMAARDEPGYDTRVPRSAGTIAENLRLNGYRTIALGKWDHARVQDLTPAGPFTYWPAGQGFERFLGFLTADTDNWNPTLWNGIEPVQEPMSGEHTLDRNLADRAIEFINARSAVSEPRPFFMYWATGTAHSPHHAPPDWVAKFKGRFDQGWDRLREEIFARQKAEGVIPESATLPARNELMPAWSSLSPEQKRMYARQMEVFAAALSYADAQFGRILDTLEQRGELDNTLVVITSDNGASAEGGPEGTFNEVIFGNGGQGTLAENLRHYDQWGSAESYPHYAFGWAVTGNTPFRYYKQTVFEGGIQVPLVVSWPRGIAARGEWRKQFVNVADVTPTILDAVGASIPAEVNGVAQQPFDGVSFRYSFSQPETVQSRTQYFESHGHKGIWFDGWKAVALFKAKAWDLSQGGNPDAPWQLYDLNADPTETRDLAKSDPAKVAELDRKFREEATRYHVFPMVGSERTLDRIANLTTGASKRSRRWSYPGPIARISEFNAPPLAQSSFRMSATVVLPTGQETGPVFAVGGALSGMSLYFKEGRPVFALRDVEGAFFPVAAAQPLSAGKHRIGLSLARAPSTSLDPTRVEIRITADGAEIAAQSLDFRMPGMMMSLSETFDMGTDDGSAVSDDYAAGTPFAGKLSDIVFETVAP